MIPNRRIVLASLATLTFATSAVGAIEVGEVAFTELLATPSPLGDMTLGSKDAPSTIVEYASMTCPHCAAFSEDGFLKLKKDWIDTGKARYVFREFPLDIKAAAAAVVARCVAKDDSEKYFTVLGALFRTQNSWVGAETAVQLRKIAADNGLDAAGFDACLKDDSKLVALKTVQDAAIKLKVNSTPTFFVDGKMIKGNAYDEIVKALEEKAGH
ncbi:protein-disulfide isomerase [Bradyrhizobium sp. USDA 4341]